MTHTIIDPFASCQFEDGQIVRINGNQKKPFTFAGMHITESDNMYHIDSDFHMSKIEQIPSETEFSKFASMRMKLAWLPNTKHDIVFEISKIVQVTLAMH